MAGITDLFGWQPPEQPQRTSIADYIASQRGQQTISAAHVSMRDKMERGLVGLLDYVMPKGKAEERAAKIVNLLDLGAPINPVAAYDSAYDSGKAYAQGRPWASAGNMGLAALATGGFGGGLKVTGNELAKGIRAYHGSPHDFERFSLDKIGTGEGAQAYGHGLYFAEHEDTAKHYRSLPGQVDGDGNYIPHPGMVNAYNPVSEARAKVDALNDKREELYARMHAETMARTPGANPDDIAPDAVAVAKYRDQWDALNQTISQAMADVDKTPYKTGRMYEVNINADPASLLDWDAPLSGQPGIAGKLSSIAGAISPDQLRGPLARTANERLRTGFPDLPGEVAYTGLGGLNPDTRAAATDALRQAGIPGIKYLDQGSRSAGEGSRNYVIFDDKLIDILRKYGLLGILSAGGAYGLAGSQPAEAAQ